MNNTPGAIVVVGFVDLSQDAAHRLTVRTRRATCSTEWRQVCSSLPANSGCPGKWTSGEFICKCVFDSFNIDNRSVYHNFILVRERQQLSIKPSLIIHPLCVIYKCRDKSRVNASFSTFGVSLRNQSAYFINNFGKHFHLNVTCSRRFLIQRQRSCHASLHRRNISADAQ